MIAFDGLVLTAFVPVAVMIFLGLGCLWKYRHAGRNDVLWFVTTVFLLMVLWRIPVVIDRRYMLAVIVPGTLLAVLFLKTLFRKFTPVGRWLCGVLLLATTIAGTAKAMRFQESKPYLIEIPDLIHEDIQRNHWENAYVLILGNGGGYFDFDESITIKQQKGNFKFQLESSNENETFFESVDSLKLDYLLLRYPVIYILVVSYEPGDVFSEHWEKRYGQQLKLCYEFIRPKDRRRNQVFRMVSPYKSAYLTSAGRREVYRQGNLLPNPDFSRYQELDVDDPVLQVWTERGVQLGQKDGRILTPAKWKLVLGAWKKALGPIGMEYTGQRKLRLYSLCDNYVALRQVAQPFAGGKVYQLGGWAVPAQDLTLYFQLLQIREGKAPAQVYTLPLHVSHDRHEFTAVLDLSRSEGEYVLQLSFANGDIELENIYLVEQVTFNDIAGNEK